MSRRSPVAPASLSLPVSRYSRPPRASPWARLVPGGQECRCFQRIQERRTFPRCLSDQWGHYDHGHPSAPSVLRSRNHLVSPEAPESPEDQVARAVPWHPSLGNIDSLRCSLFLHRGRCASSHLRALLRRGRPRRGTGASACCVVRAWSHTCAPKTSLHSWSRLQHVCPTVNSGYGGGKKKGSRGGERCARVKKFRVKVFKAIPAAPETCSNIATRNPAK